MEPGYARKKLEVIAMLKNASLRGLHLMSIVADIWKQPVKIKSYMSFSDCPAFANIVREGWFEQLDKACYT